MISVSAGFILRDDHRPPSPDYQLSRIATTALPVENVDPQTVVDWLIRRLTEMPLPVIDGWNNNLGLGYTEAHKTHPAFSPRDSNFDELDYAVVTQNFFCRTDSTP